MPEKKPLVDEKCYELAVHFTKDHPGISESDVWDLCSDIQATVELWFLDKDIEDPRIPPLDQLRPPKKST
jgi:hypothetical protein